jgi:hypothetical protein
MTDNPVGIGVDQLLSLTRSSTDREVEGILSQLRYDDLTDEEMIALLILLRPVHARVVESFRPVGKPTLLVVPRDPGTAPTSKAGAK